MTAGRVEAHLAADPARMAGLAAVAALGLPDCRIGAGFVRNAVWDLLHGYDPPTPLADIDIVYLDRKDLGRSPELAAEAYLVETLPGRP